MNQKGKETIINSFVYSDFNCSSFLAFYYRKIAKQIRKIQKRCLRVVLNYYLRNYPELLQSSGSVLMKTQQLRVEMFKTLNDLKPKFMKEIFYRSQNLIVLHVVL